LRRSPKAAVPLDRQIKTAIVWHTTSLSLEAPHGEAT
jgi:hypothetical protein